MCQETHNPLTTKLVGKTIINYHGQAITFEHTFLTQISNYILSLPRFHKELSDRGVVFRNQTQACVENITKFSKIKNRFRKQLSGF